MAMMPVNVQLYLEQWLKVASGGKITAQFAFAADRVRFMCHTCQATYSVATPKDTTIDFGVQQFVELHSHKGGYTKPTGDMVWDKDMNLVPLPDLKPVPLTADFKKIDDKPESAKKIFDATLKYKQEMNAKWNDDEKFAAQIAELQKQDTGKVKYTANDWVTYTGETYDAHIETATDDELEQAEAAAAALKAIENALKIKQLKAKMKDIENNLPTPGQVAPVKNDGGEILKIATGRKFR